MSGGESEVNVTDESDDEETIDVEESYETKVVYCMITSVSFCWTFANMPTLILA